MRVALLVATAVLATACSAAPSPQIIYATPEPTVFIPSPVPTPEPTPVVASGWQPYLEHTLATSQLWIAKFTAVQNAASAGDVVGVGVAGGGLEALANSEIGWLDANQPEPCFANVHRLYRVVVQHYADAGRYLAAGSASYDVAALQLGLDALNAGNAGINTVTAAVKLVAC
jgi:hypothetical protein